MRRVFVAFAAVAAAAFASPAVLAASCPASPPIAPLPLSHLKAALARGEEGIIVALGSSSTQGIMASDPGRSYPAELQDALSDDLPQRHIAVINRGIGGQDAAKELERLDSDVIAIRPQLVIWQVGANAALHADSLGDFRQRVSAGVRKLQAAGIDVVLMDNQRAPRLLASTQNQSFGRALADIARETGAGLFSRDHLMATWAEEGAPSTEFIAVDGLHHNDLGYHCVARALSADILTAVRPSVVSASR